MSIDKKVDDRGVCCFSFGLLQWVFSFRSYLEVRLRLLVFVFVLAFDHYGFRTNEKKLK